MFYLIITIIIKVTARFRNLRVDVLLHIKQAVVLQMETRSPKKKAADEEGAPALIE